MLWIIINDIAELSPAQTTAALVLAAARRCLVGVCDFRTLSVDADGVVHGMVYSAGSDGIAALKARAPELRALTPTDAVLCRTNPGRTPYPGAHRTALMILALAEAQGVPVVNSATGLQRAAAKLYLHHLPAAVRPRTLVCQTAAQALAFVRAATEPVILKPLEGTRGTDVFKVTAKDANLRQIVDVLVRQGPLMVQDWLPDAVNGDVRVLLLDGVPLRVDGALASVRRRPPAHDFRSNVFRGGTAEYAAEVPGIDAIAAAIRPQLQADGLVLVGLDVIGGRIVEANVFSPGGLADMGRFAGVDFETPLLDRLFVRLGLG